MQRTLHLTHTLRTTLPGLALLALAACGGGGGGDSSTPVSNPPPQGPTNSSPVANAGADQSVDEGVSVDLNGSGTDADAGDTLTYAWAQTAGPDVTLADASAAATSFTAPDVNGDQNLSFELTVSDGELSDTDSITVTVRDVVTGGGDGDVSGTVSYEFVPPNSNCRGLDFASTEVRPIRQATVQLLDASSGSVLDSTVADDNGRYAFSGAPLNTSLRLRVLAELKRSGAPSWDVEIRDNVVDPNDTSPPALPNRPKYAVDSASFTLTGGALTRDLVARTNWGGGSFSTGSYVGPRAAAPFAILDAIYTGMQLMLTVDSDATFAPLDAFWSVNNRLVSGSFDIDAGELGASFYRSDIDSLFLLGDANGDSEEFDDHVIVHEWGHYFEDNFSRSDSIGGPHGVGDRLDARLAFGEGWATALSGIALENDLYCDTNFQGSGGFGIGIEDGSFDARGWYDEITVLRFIYDLWDTNDEGIVTVGDLDDTGDPGSIGFLPIYNTMIGPQANTEALTSVFSFGTELRSMLGAADRDFFDYAMRRADMNPTNIDIYGANEEANREDVETARDVLPLYTDLPTDGTPVEICVNSDYDSNRSGNKLAEYRYLRINPTQSGLYDVNITTLPTTPPLPADDPNDERDQSDPDMYIFSRGAAIARGISGAANSEVFTTQNSLNAGSTYIAELTEFRYQDADSPSDFPTQVCFDVSMTRQ